MKTQLLSLFAIAALAFSCGDAAKSDDTTAQAPTACECVEHYNTKNADMTAQCDELRKDEAFEKEFINCKAKDVTGSTGNMDVQQSESLEVEMPAEGTFMFMADKSKITWTGSKITGDKHVGTVALKDGSITFDANGIANAELVIDMTSMDNIDLADDAENQGKLLGHLKSDDFFGVDTYPTATFSLAGVQMAEATGMVTGQMTVKDKTNEESAKVVIAKSGKDMVVITGTLTFDRAKYDVRYGSGSFFEGLGDNLIKDDVMLKFQLKGKMEKMPS
jgi:polyisoprenoid-binding protein YceI